MKIVDTHRMKKNVVTEKDLYSRIRQILESARASIAGAVNSDMVVAYWRIGREIIEEEQNVTQCV